MAKTILVNTVKGKGQNGPVLFHAGATIDDSQVDTSKITAAGGILAPTTWPTVSSNAAVATKLRKGGEDRERPELDAMMMAAYLADSVALDQNRGSSNGAAGATVAAGAAMSTAVTITPTYSGKVRIRAWASIQGLTSGTWTPVLKQGTSTIAAPAQYTGHATTFPSEAYVELEVTGLTLGTSVTFNWVTTAGDATVTLGNGSTGQGSGLSVQEVP